MILFCLLSHDFDNSFYLQILQLWNSELKSVSCAINQVHARIYWFDITSLVNLNENGFTDFAFSQNSFKSFNVRFLIFNQCSFHLTFTWIFFTWVTFLPLLSVIDQGFVSVNEPRFRCWLHHCIYFSVGKLGCLGPLPGSCLNAIFLFLCRLYFGDDFFHFLKFLWGLIQLIVFIGKLFSL